MRKAREVPLTKNCEACNKEFTQPETMTNSAWMAKKACSPVCVNALRKGSRNQSFGSIASITPLSAAKARNSGIVKKR
jgi:hypothetical protein